MQLYLQSSVQVQSVNLKKIDNDGRLFSHSAEHLAKHPANKGILSPVEQNTSAIKNMKFIRYLPKKNRVSRK